MSKTNLRSTINLTKDKYSLESRLTQSSTLKSLSRGSFNNSSNPSSSSNSMANISVNFMKDSSFPKLFNQSSMLFSFNGQPQTTTNSSLRNSLGFSGLGSGTRTPSSLSSFNNLFEKDHSRKNSLFAKKTNELVIDISKKKNIQRQTLKSSFNSTKKQFRPTTSLNSVNSVSEYSTQPLNETIPKQENIRVFVRIKPCENREIWIKPYIMRIDEKHVDIQGKFLAYDYVFPVETKQDQVFQRVAKPVLSGLFEGFNGTIFAYGQTGSGKTHTIFGGNTVETQGLISRSIKFIFSNLKEDCKVSLSLLQIYKQELFDLLNENNKVDLKIKQTISGVYVQGLSRINIKSIEQTILVIENSLKNRKVASTKLNQKSSRSHTILTIYTQSMDLQSKLCLIDLAGSQKANKAGVVGQNFEEMKKINYSLSCLGNVINALVTRKKTDHIPFRDSKLTRMLKDSLSGKFRTSIIVNCSSDPGTQDETMSSLKFADRAKKVKITLSKCNTKGKQNVEYLHKVIQQLTTDLQNTKRELNKYKQICVQKNQQKSETKTQNQAKKKQNTNQSPDITPRQTIPSERANLDQQMKKYNKQQKHINVASIFHKQQRKRTFIPLSELSSLNVSKSTIKMYGEINSPSVSSLSYRPDDGIDDLSFHFSSMKEEHKMSSIQNQQKN